MNDLLMNDTFENFNFTQSGQIVTQTVPSLPFNLLNQENRKEIGLNLENEDYIFLDDSIFLSQVSFTENKKTHSGQTEISELQTKKQLTVCDSFQNITLNKTSTKNENVILSQQNNIKNESKINHIEQKDLMINRLSSWGLPKNILQKYESKNVSLMFPWQVECLKQRDVLNGKNLVYSAPTSAGKTLVAEIIAIKTILELKKKVIFILPFVSIVREKMYHFQNLLESSGIRVDGFMGSYNPPGGFGSVQFAICTIEKANNLINRLLEEGKLGDIGAVLIDEIHLLGDSSRGYILELLLTKLRYISKKSNLSIQIVGMSATLPNLDQVAKWLDAELYTTDFRPVPLNEQAQVDGKIFDNNLKLVRKINLLPELKTDCDNILQLCLETIRESCSVLIFCPTKNWCENLAQQIATGFFKIGSLTGKWTELLRSQLDTNLIIELLEQLKYCPVGLDDVLRKTASFGVAFHHAGLTMDERDIIEGAFRNGTLRVLVATSTLSSGVNLPARRVIIRTPNFHGKPIDSLIYRQMIGRAGRMGKDSIGESFLICQKNDFKIVEELMSAKLKPVKSCLKTAGKLKRAILEVVASGVASTPKDVKLFTECTLLATEDVSTHELSDPIEETMLFLQINEFVRLQTQDDGSDKFVPTSLGKACLSSSIAPDEGLSLFTELEKARQCLVLETELHLIYLVTPYSACYSWENLDWMLYLNLWEKLPLNMKKVGELVGIREVYIVNATRKKMQRNTEKAFHKDLIHKRFFVALALQDLVNEKPLSWVCQKFNCNRGMLQSLQQSASSFAGMVTAFSRQLGWASMELLLSQFQDRMQFGVNRDLLDLMHLPILNGKMARSLYNAGIETVIELANSEISSIESLLHSVAPFESEKNREGESAFEKKQRNKFRNIWIAGREGLTEREAANIFITEARKYLKIEMGLVDAKWEKGEEENEEVLSEKENQDEENIDVQSLNTKIETTALLSNHQKVPNGNDIPVDTIIDTTPKNQIDKIDVDKHCSDDSSSFSNKINISDTSSILSSDSTKIEDDFEENFVEKSLMGTPKLKDLNVCNLNMNENKKDVLKMLKEISLSDFSDTLSETSQLSSKKTITPTKDGVKEVSNLMKRHSLELNMSGSSVQTNMSVSLTNMQSDQSLFDESLNMQDISKDSAIGGLIEEQDNIPCLKSNSSNESIQSGDDIFEKSLEEDLLSSAKKRKNDSFEGTKLYKKIKTKENTFIQQIEDINKTYILDELEDQPNADFSKMEVVNVCQELMLLEAFSKEIKEKDKFSFSLACSKYVENKPTIGMNIINTQSLHLRSSLNSQEQNNTFICDERKIEGFSFSWENDVVYYLSLSNAILHQKILKLLKTIFKNRNIRVKMFDSKEQIKVLENCCGISFCCKVEDPKIANWILDPEGKESNLKAMVLKFSPEGTGLSQLSGGCKGVGSVGLDIYSTVDAKIRSSLECVLTWHLTETLKRILIEQSPKYLGVWDVENEIIVILARMELDGIGLNKTALKNLLDTLKTQISTIEKRAFTLAGRNFNFVSSVDVAKVTGMFRGRKVSTRKQVLKKNQHPISDLVLQWRKLHSILTKTLYPLMQATKGERIHGCYITHTATGRISMHEPNLQNINKDFEFSISASKENVSISCRELFEAAKGYALVSADYCQLELRILTHFSQDKLLCTIMREPGDVFKIIGAKWNNIKEEDVTDNIRQNTKQLCYGIIYGMGSKTLADQLNIQEIEAIDFMETFRNTYPGIKTFIRQTIENCRKCGYVETVNGRKRFLPHILDNEQTKKEQAERQAVNTIIQGSAADIVKGAMIKVENELKEVFQKTKSKPKMVLHLHDELMYEVPNKYLRKVAKIIKKNMENSVVMSVPFPVKLKSGESWGTMSELIL